jgi:membrane protein
MDIHRYGNAVSEALGRGRSGTSSRSRTPAKGARRVGIVALFRQAWRDWSEDKASRLAAALAYYTALSLAPMVVLGVLVLKFVNIDGQQLIEQQMAALMGGPGADMARQMIENAKTSDGWLAGAISFAVLLWGASNVFAQLQDSLNTIWEVRLGPAVGWWRTIQKRFLSMAMVFGIGFLLLVSLFVTTVLSAIAERMVGDDAAIGFALDIVSTFLVTWAFFALIFRFLPDAKIAFRGVLPGAAVTALLFTVGKFILSWYLAQGTTASAFGAAGSLAAVLVWVYYSAQIMFFGAELTQAHAQLRGDWIARDPEAVPVTDAKRAQEGLVRGRTGARRRRRGPT